MAASSERSSSTSSAPTATGGVSWARRFVYGQFGENFTVDGLADDEVCIGDRYRIGTAVFEVTQPRVTCYRVGIRMDEPRMAAMLVSHGRPGFYLRVLVEGEVQAGDDIVKVASGPEADDRCRGRRSALPAGPPPRRRPARAPDSRAQRWVAILVPRAARGGRQRQRGTRCDEPASRLVRIPSAHGQPGRQRERLDRVHPPRRPRRHPRAGSASRTVSDTPPSTRAGTAVAPAQLFAVRAARR